MCNISLFVTFQVWSVENGERLSYQHDCQDFYVKPCVFYNDSNKIASAKKPGRILVRGKIMYKLPFTIHDRFGVQLIRTKLSIAMTLVAMKVRSPFYVSASVEMTASWGHQLRMDLWPYVSTLIQ